MKKIFTLLLAISFIVVATAAFATIANTRHNLTAGSGFTETTDATATLCGFCHIPHGGDTSVAALPLWARDVSGLGPYTVYGGGNTLAATPILQPGTFSLTCLSCHDGTMGLGTITKNGVSSSYAMITTLPGGLGASGEFLPANIDPATGYSPFLDTDLQNDHPVGFNFPPAGYGAGGGIPGISLTVTDSGLATSRLVGAFSTSDYPVFQTGSVGTGLDEFECATCHEPHREDTAGQTKFLRGPNATLCQDCHDTK
jgi:predicted CXXCH cytochrome family protein